MKARTSKLDCGARVVTVQQSTARAHAAVLLRGGPVFEADATWGLSHFLEHMVFRGTRGRRDSRAVALAADAFGGEVAGATYRDRVLFDTRVDPERVGEALDLLGDMILRPRFEGIDIEREVIREELLEILDDEGREIDPDNLAFSRLFDGHPLARSIDGTEDTLDTFDEPLLRAFHQQTYRLADAVIAVAGPVSHDATVAAAAQGFRGNHGQGAEPRAPRRRNPKRLVQVVRTEASQTQLRLVFRTGGVADPDRRVLSLLSRVLDDGPASRFTTRLIDAEGLAYSLWCTTDNYDDAGVFEVGAQCQHERVVDVVRALCRELGAIRDRAPTKAERERSVARFARDLRDLADRPGQTAETAARAVQIGERFAPRAWIRALGEVSPADCTRVAKRVLRRDNLACVLVGLPTAAEGRAVETILEETFG